MFLWQVLMGNRKGLPLRHELMYNRRVHITNLKNNETQNNHTQSPMKHIILLCTLLIACQAVSVGQIARNSIDSSAIKAFTKAIERNPNNINAYSRRAERKYRLKDYHGAIDDYTRIIELKYNQPDAYYDRGKAKAALLDYHGAIEDYTKAIEVIASIKDTNLDSTAEDHISESSCYYARGKTKATLTDYLGAILDYTKAIEADSEFLDYYHIYRGMAKAALNNHEDAIQDYNMVLNRKDILCSVGMEGYFYQRGISKAALEDYEGAIKDFTYEMEVDPFNANAYTGRGLSKEKLQDYEEAIDDFTQAIELDPENAAAYYYRGNTKVGTKLIKSSGCSDWHKAAELGHKKALDSVQRYCK